MKFYLSSFKLGNKIEELKEMISVNKTTAYIANARDFAEGESWVNKFTQSDISDLKNVGLKVQKLDLRNYFQKNTKLLDDIRKFGVIWVSGGNVFVLRQAFKLSGFDKALHQLKNQNSNLLYGGYSAGICVLSPSLQGLELVDSIKHFPYKKQKSIIWEGLGILNFAVAPHFNSNHPESEAINKVIDFYEKNGINHKKLRDGEVIVIK